MEWWRCNVSNSQLNSLHYASHNCVLGEQSCKGGAIYISDVNPLIDCIQITPYIAAYLPREECFFQLPKQNLYSGHDVKLVFRNNSADDAGCVLYGGAIDSCKLNGLNSYTISGKVFDRLFPRNVRDYNTVSNISSDPLHICPCKDNLPDCRRLSYRVLYLQVYPGKAFQVPVVAVGQRDGTVLAL